VGGRAARILSGGWSAVAVVATVWRLTSIEYYLFWLGLDPAEREEATYSFDAPEAARGVWASYGRFVRDGTTVESADIRRLAAGFDPRTGESLVQRNTARRAVAYDLQLAAPKSLSVLWALADKGQRRLIETAQTRAVRAALDAVITEGLIETRRGKGGAVREAAQELAIATFAHHTNREGEAHLHTHCVILNACVREDGTTGAIDNVKLLHHKLAVGAAYRAELARELHALGLVTEADPKYQFGFWVKGVPLELCKAQSKRRAQVEAALAAQGLTSADSGRLADIAAKGSRKSKKAEAAVPEVLRARWQAEAVALGLDPARVWEWAIDAGAAGGAGDDLPLPEVADRLVAEALAALSEQEAVLERRHVLRAALERAERQSPVRCGYTEIAAAIERALAAERLVQIGKTERGTVYATPSAIEMERRMLRAALSRQGERAFFTPSQIAMAAAARRLSAEQAAAVRHALGPDGVAVIEGRPGAGKSFAQGPVAKAARAAGYKVHAIAPTWRAAEILRRDTDTLADDARALAGFVARLSPEHPEAIRLDKRTLIIVDEASMLGLRDATTLLEAAAAAGAKLILTGDTRQLLGVGGGGGDVFGSLAEKLGRATMAEIRRQKVDWQREASMAAAQGDLAAALFAYAEQDRVVLADDRAGAVAKMAAGYVAARLASPKASMLMIGRRNTDVRDLNRHARAGLRVKGLLGGPDYIVASAPRWAEGREEAMGLAVGDRIVFTEEVRIGRAVLRTNMSATITAIAPGRAPDDPEVTIRADDGQVVSGYWRDFIGYRKAGSADRTPRVQHAYAVNANTSQGETVDEAFVLGHGLRSRSALVALTRHEQDCHIYLERERLEALLALEPIVPLVVTTEGQLRARDAPPPEPKGEAGVLELEPVVADARTGARVAVASGGGEGLQAYLAVQARLWAAPETRENPSAYLAPTQAELLPWLGLDLGLGGGKRAAAYVSPASQNFNPAAAPADEGLRAAPQAKAPVMAVTAAGRAPSASEGEPGRRKPPAAKPRTARPATKPLPFEDADADPAQAPNVRAEEDQRGTASQPSADKPDAEHPAVPEAAADARSRSAAAPAAGADANPPAEPRAAEAPTEAQEAAAGKEIVGNPIEATDGAVPVPAAPGPDKDAAPEPVATADKVDAPEPVPEVLVSEEVATHGVAAPARGTEAAGEDLAAEAQPTGSGKAGPPLILDAHSTLDGPLALDVAAIMAGERFDLAAAPAKDMEGSGAPAGALAELLSVGVGAGASAGANPSLLPAGKPGQQKAKQRAARRPSPQRVIQQGLPLWHEVDADLAAGLAKARRLEQAGQEVRPSEALRAGAAAAADEVAAVAPADPAIRFVEPAAVPSPAGGAAAREGITASVAPVATEGGPSDAVAGSEGPAAADPLAARRARIEPRDQPATPHSSAAARQAALRREMPLAWPVPPDAALSSPASAAALAARLAALDPQDLRQGFRRRQFARKVPASFRPIMAELVERQQALQLPFAEIVKSQRGMIRHLEGAAERVGQAWAVERHVVLQGARRPQFLLPAASFDAEAKPRVIPAKEIEAQLAKLPDVSQARGDLRAILEVMYRDPDRAARRLQMLRRQHSSTAAAARHLARQGAAILGPLAGTQRRLFTQAERAKQWQAGASAGRIGEAALALDTIETQQRARYIEEVWAAEAETRRRLAVAVPSLSRRAEAAVAALHKAGLRPDWRQPRGQPAAEDCRLAANIAPLWARVLAEPALRGELERFAQAAAERLSWPRVLEIAAAVAAQPHAKAELVAEEKAAVLAHGIAAARALHQLHPEFQRLAEIERCRSAMTIFPFGKDVPKPVLALWQMDILVYAWRTRPPASNDPVQQDIILRWERVRATPGVIGRLNTFVKAAEAALRPERIREVALARQPDGSRPGIDRDVMLVADAVSVIKTASALATANPDLAAQARQVIEQERLKAAREAAWLQEIEQCRSVLPEFPFGQDAPAALRVLLMPQVFDYAWRQRPPAAQDPAQQDILLQWERVLADNNVTERVFNFRGKVLSILPRERIREIAQGLRPDGSHPSADPDIARLAYAVSVIDAAVDIHRSNPEQVALARARLEQEKRQEVQRLAAPGRAVAPRKQATGTTATIKVRFPGAGI
jgi:conjugative relaxase-like TrwC/TraI family protein